MSVLLDSVILIDHLNGRAAATTYLREDGPSAAVSAVTCAEVLAGTGESNVARVRALLDAFVFVPIDRPIAERASELRRQHRWKLPDALQVAAAESRGLPLATRNTGDFPPERFDFVRVPYRM